MTEGAKKEFVQICKLVAFKPQPRWHRLNYHALWLHSLMKTF